MTTDAKSKTQEGPKKLTVREIEELPRADFDRLSKEDKQRFFFYMDRQNFPSPAEFYGYGSELESDDEFASPEDDDEPMTLFPLGRVVSTPQALEALEPEDIARALSQHEVGGWGECSPDDWEANNRSLREGLRLVSVYRSQGVKRFLVITEADRSVTTVMLPEEY